MKLKGISPIIAEILMVVTVLALAGSSYFIIRLAFFSEERFEKQQESLMIVNDKEESITFLTVSVDGQSANVYIQDGIIPAKGAGNVTLLNLPKGKKSELKLCDRDICNRFVYDVSVGCSIYLDGNSWMPEKYFGKFDLKKVECIRQIISSSSLF